MFILIHVLVKRFVDTITNFSNILFGAFCASDKVDKVVATT